MIKIGVDFPPGMEAKGRNGYFRLARATVWGFPDQPLPVEAEFWSKRLGGGPPIRLELTREGARMLGEALLKAAEADGDEPNG